MTNTERLEKIINSPRLRNNSKSFVESLFEQSKKRELSEKQIEYVNKFWEECFPPQEILDAEAEWSATFSPEMKENMTIIGQYYEHHYPSSKIAKNYKDPNWIPDKGLYDKSISSQYAKVTISNYKKTFRFNVGDTIVFRDTQINRSRYPREWLGSPLLVLSQDKNAKDNFVNQYTVISMLHMEEQRTLQVKEDHLNVLKNKKK